MLPLQKKYWHSWMTHLTDKEQFNLNRVEEKVYQLFSDDNSGHSYDHIKRVVNLTTRLIVKRADYYVTLMIAYLHDIFDDKMDFGFKDMSSLYETWGLHEDGKLNLIDEGVKSIGFKGGFVAKEKSLEAQIVSDADLLDAMGAIGIARTFYYAGHKGIPFHDTKLEGVIAMDYEDYRHLKRNAIAHFDEKLLNLKDYIVTDKGKAIAKKRHDLIETFYKDFMDEIHGIK